MAYDAIFLCAIDIIMKAEKVIRDRKLFEDGHIMEVVVWLVPTKVPPSKHRYKYRLFYGQKGTRKIGYDNERGKGDHKHIYDKEYPYTFISLAQLLDDFETDVSIERGEAI